MPWRLFTNEYWSPTSVRNQTHGIQYTSFINADSYFDLSLKIDTKDCGTGHGPGEIPQTHTPFLVLVMMYG